MSEQVFVHIKYKQQISSGPGSSLPISTKTVVRTVIENVKLTS